MGGSRIFVINFFGFVVAVFDLVLKYGGYTWPL